MELIANDQWLKALKTKKTLNSQIATLNFFVSLRKRSEKYENW